MKIIAVANQKGGCGKTTTAINLSSSLAMKSKKVLLIDFDPQAHATMGLSIDPYGLEKSMYDVISAGEYNHTTIQDIRVPVGDNFDIAPSSAMLSAVEQELSGANGRENRLKHGLDSVDKLYDYVIIDCPPSIGHLCFNALMASEEVIIPIDLSLFSLRGVSKLMEIVVMLKEKADHEVTARALITMFDFRTRYSRHVMEKVKEKFGKNMLDTVIRYNIRLRETVDYGLPIAEYDKRSIGFRDYDSLAEEILALNTVAHVISNPAESARDLLYKSEKYVDETRSSLPEDVIEHEEEYLGENTGYFYQTMVEAIAARTAKEDMASGEDSDDY